MLQILYGSSEGKNLVQKMRLHGDTQFHNNTTQFLQLGKEVRGIYHLSGRLGREKSQQNITSEFTTII